MSFWGHSLHSPCPIPSLYFSYTHNLYKIHSHPMLQFPAGHGSHWRDSSVCPAWSKRKIFVFSWSTKL
eukprot:UN17810